MNDSHPARKSPLKLLLLGALTSFAAGYGLNQTIQGRPWWLLLPVAAFGLMSCEMWRLVRWEKRDMELTALADSTNWADSSHVDLSLIDLHRWADRPWACDLEDGTGHEDGERR